MATRTFSMAFTLALLFQATAAASTFFYDDFEDGSVVDGSPVTWNETYPPWNTGTREVIDGSYVLTPGFDAIRSNYWENDSNVEGLVFRDFSIRTQARVLGTENGVAIGFNARDTHPQSPDGQTGRNIYAWLGTDGSMEIGLGVNNATASILATLQSNLRPTDEDVILRMDVFGESVKLWAWPADDARPTSPQLAVNLPGRPPTPFNTAGQVGIWNGQVDVDLSDTMVPVAFRYVEVVPEPSTLPMAALAAAGLVVVRFARGRALHR